METYTVKKLRAIAKERGIKRYSSLRKAELIATINAHLADNHSLVDAPVPDISASVITPTKYVAPPQKEVKTGVLSTIKSFADWLISYVPKQIKKPINEALEALKAKVAQLFGKINKYKFVLRESKSAMNGFTKQYTADGRPGMDAVSFLKAVRPLVVDFLKRNRRIKVQLVLVCKMEHVCITDEIIDEDNMFFHSNTEVTDVNELYTNAVDKMMENMAKCQKKWKRLQICGCSTAGYSYRPVRASERKFVHSAS